MASFKKLTITPTIGVAAQAGVRAAPVGDRVTHTGERGTPLENMASPTGDRATWVEYRAT